MSFPFSTEEVLNLLGYSSNNRSSIYIQCPFCKSSNKPLNIDMKTSMYRCNKNPEHKGNILTFYKELSGCTSNKEAYHEILKRLQIEDITLIPKVEENLIQEVEFDEEKTNLILTKVLEKSFLSSKNRKELLERGFSKERIDKLMYKTLPKRNGKEIIKFVYSLNDNDSYDFSGVIGFFVSKKGYWVIAHNTQGVMIPYRNFWGKIHGIQIRKDEEIRKIDPETGIKEEKYTYLTSRNRKNGTPARQCVHYSGEFTEKGLSIKNGTLVLIEGGMKGDLFYELTNQPTINIPGVQCIKILEKEFPILKAAGVHTIMNGFDMDRITNINVLEPLLKIEKKIKDYGFNYKQLAWNTNYMDRNGHIKELCMNTMFVFTPETLKKEIEKNTLTNTLTRVRKCNRTRIMFALSSIEESKKEVNKKLFLLLVEECNKCGFFEISPIIWKLKCKGIDDYYAYKLKGIIS